MRKRACLHMKAECVYSFNFSTYYSEYHVDFKKEFQYREEMDSRVSDRLAVFKQAESESKTKAEVRFTMLIYLRSNNVPQSKSRMETTGQCMKSIQN